MVENPYSPQNTEVIEVGYRHATLEDKQSSMYNLLLEIKEWMDTTGTGASNVSADLESFESRLYNQMISENQEDLLFYDMIVSVAKEIRTHNRFTLQKLRPNLYHLVGVVEGVCSLYKEFKEGFVVYQDSLYKELSKDLKNPIDNAHFQNFVNNTLGSGKYCDLLVEIQDVIEKPSTNTYKIAGYTYLFQIPLESVITEYTSMDTLIGVLMGVQNNRIYPNREDTIGLIGDCLNVHKTILVLYNIYKIEIARWRLSISNNAPIYNLLNSTITNFIATLDMSLVPVIMEILKQFEGTIEDISNQNKSITDLTKAVMNSANSFLDAKVESFMGFMDKIDGKLRKASEFLSSLQIKPDYTALNESLRKTEELVGKLNEILNDNVITATIAGVVDMINSVVKMINRVNESINNALCLIQQALCFIGGILNFMDTVVGPLLAKLDAIVAEMISFWDDAVAEVMGLVEMINKKIKEIVYRQVEVQLIAMGPDVGTAIGVTADSKWYLDWGIAVDAIILELLGQSGPSLQSLVTQTQNKLDDLADSFTNSLKGSNCPPIKLPDMSLNLPRLDLTANIPSVNPINFDLKC